MAFNRYFARGVTTTASTVRTATSTDVIIGLRVTNTSAAAIKVSVWITGGGGDNYLVGGTSGTVATTGADVPVGGSIVVVSGDADKVVLVNGDAVKVISSAVTSCDCIISLLEAA